MLYSGLLFGFGLVLSVRKTYVVECEKYVGTLFNVVDNLCCTLDYTVVIVGAWEKQLVECERYIIYVGHEMIMCIWIGVEH